MGAFNQPTRSAIGISHLLCARALRDFGDGFVAVLLPVYLLGARASGRFEVGVVATAALLGSALLTLGVGFLGARYDHRRLLLAAASLMIATGVAFAVVDDFALLLVVAFAGTLNPSAGSVSVFVPLEHAVLAREVAERPTHQVLRALQPDRRAGRRGRRARRRRCRMLMAPFGLDQLDRAQGRCSSSMPRSAWPAACSTRASRAHAGAGSAAPARARAIAPHRLQARRPVQPRCLRRRLRRPVAAGAVAVRALRPVARGREPVLLLVGRALGVLLSGRGLAVAAHRPRQHDGVHAHPVEHLPDAGGVRADAAAGARAAARPRGAVADGCADALVLRHGGRHRGRARGRRELHLGAAQPCRRGQPDARRRAVRRLVPGLAAGDLRRPQDRLRPAAAAFSSGT